MSEQPKANLYASLIAAQAEFPSIDRDRTGQSGNRKYGYATLAECVESTKAILAKHGLGVMQPLGEDDKGNPVVRTRLIHTSGEFEEGFLRIPVARDMQEAGSCVTYARRYGYLAILGIPVAAEEDDDGRANKERGGNQQQQQGPRQEARQPAQNAAGDPQLRPDEDLIVSVENKGKRGNSKDDLWLIKSYRGVECTTFDIELGHVAEEYCSKNRKCRLITREWRKGNSHGLTLNAIEVVLDKQQNNPQPAQPPAQTQPAPASSPPSQPGKANRTRVACPTICEQRQSGNAMWWECRDGQANATFYIQSKALANEWDAIVESGMPLDVIWVPSPKGAPMVRKIERVSAMEPVAGAEKTPWE